MQNTSISFKTFLVTAVLAWPFVVQADDRSDLQAINNNIGQNLQSMEIDLDNQQYNTGPTKLRGGFKHRLTSQLSQLKILMAQAVNAVNNNAFGSSGSQTISGNDYKIAAMITNAVANLDRLGQLEALDNNIRSDVKEFLQRVQQSIQPGTNISLVNKLSAALGILNRG